VSVTNDTRVCVPLNEKTLGDLTAATLKAADAADFVELRVDGLLPQELTGASAKLENLINSISRQVILTFRSSEEGGYRPLTKTQRRAFWHEYVKSNAALFDIEMDLVAELTNSQGNEQPDWSRVIRLLAMGTVTADAIDGALGRREQRSAPEALAGPWWSLVLSAAS